MIISCIIPTYNRAHFLSDAIKTAREQILDSDVEIEIIVVDDGSTDNTAGLVASLGEDIRYIKLLQNCGVSAARNAGVKAARGEYIAFLDSDDLWMPDKLQKQTKLMQENDGCELVCGLLQVEKMTPDAHKYAMLYGEPFRAVAVGTSLYHRHLFEPDCIGLFDESMRTSEDFDWLNRARESNIYIVVHNDVVLRYRKHTDSLTGLYQDFAVSKHVFLSMLKKSLDRRRQHQRESINMTPLSPCIGAASVIIPVRNCERYLEQAIDSVLAQTRPPLEIIVVDDGSTDRTATIAQRYGQPVRYVYQAPRGAASARNHGVAVASGNMLAFLDADDLWLPDKLGLQMSVLESRTRLDMVFCNAEQFVSEDAERKQDSIPERLRVVAAMCAGGMLMWRRAFDRVGSFNETYVRVDVVDWIARANQIGLKHYAIPEVLMRRRWHDSNMGVTERDKAYEYTQVVKAALERRRASAQSS